LEQSGKEKYPVAAHLEFKEFHGTIMGAETDKLEAFLKKYEDSEVILQWNKKGYRPRQECHILFCKLWIC
jgi:hypothetical protein